MTMLEQHEVAAYLLARRLISRRSIVSGRLRVLDASSRNRNFRVTGGPGESYLIKQGLAADSAHTLANEAALYRRLAPVASWIPRLVLDDEEHGPLVIEWIEGGEALDRRGRCSPAHAAALGRVLAELHAIAPDDEDLRRDAPWVLALHRPPLDAVRYFSAASVELVTALQRDAGACGALDELRESWSADALVHRDVKWANCVVHGRAVALVDWEMAGWGDPAGDVGSALGEFARHPAAANAFWRAYAAARRLTAAAAARLLERSLRHAGARLLQTAYEHAQELAALDARAAGGLHAARDLLTAAPDAAARRLGIAP